MTTATQSLFDPAGMATGGRVAPGAVKFGPCSVVTTQDTPFEVGEQGVQCFLKLGATPAGEDEPSFEYLPFGSLEKFTPNADGTGVVSQGDSRVGKRGKLGLFFASLVAKGFPVSSFPADNTVTFLDGIEAKIDYVDMNTSGKDSAKFMKKDGTKPSALVIVELLVVPGVKGMTPAKGATKAGAGAAAKAAPAATGGAGATAKVSAEVAEAAAQNAVIDVLLDPKNKQADGSRVTSKRTLPTDIMKRITDVAVRAVAFPYVGNNAWLGDEARPWAFNVEKAELTATEMTDAFFAARG